MAWQTMATALFGSSNHAAPLNFQGRAKSAIEQDSRRYRKCGDMPPAHQPITDHLSRRCWRVALSALTAFPAFRALTGLTKGEGAGAASRCSCPTCLFNRHQCPVSICKTVTENGAKLWSKLRPRPFTLTVTGTAFSVSPGLLVAEGLLLMNDCLTGARDVANPG